MKTVIFNDANLNMKDIEVDSLKARAVMINKAKEIFVTCYNGVYLLPGGKIDKRRRYFVWACKRSGRRDWDKFKVRK